MALKYQAIDLMAMRVGWTQENWVRFLDRAVLDSDVRKLIATMYGIQAGMDRLAKLKLNTEKMCAWFAKLSRDIEKAFRAIARKEYPRPGPSGPDALSRWSVVKKKREVALRRFIRDSRY